MAENEKTVEVAAENAPKGRKNFSGRAKNDKREPRERKEREGRNLQTKEPMIIPASKTPKFRPGKALKDLVNA